MISGHLRSGVCEGSSAGQMTGPVKDSRAAVSAHATGRPARRRPAPAGNIGYWTTSSQRLGVSHSRLLTRLFELVVAFHMGGGGVPDVSERRVRDIYETTVYSTLLHIRLIACSGARLQIDILKDNFRLLRDWQRKSYSGTSARVMYTY